MKLSLQARINAMTAVTVVLAVALGLLGLRGMGSSNQGLETVYQDRTVALEQVSRIDSLLLTNRLALAASIVRAIAAGDLSIPVTTAARDENSLLFCMRQMKDHLARSVSEIRRSTDTIALASGEIASGNLDLSSRTERQASSLEETASSMEELTSTVNHNGTHARHANQLARTVSVFKIDLHAGPADLPAANRPSTGTINPAIASQRTTRPRLLA